MSMSAAGSTNTPVTIVVGLNGALQKRFIMGSGGSQLIPGNVHRATQVQTGVGGKGQDVAISLSCLQYYYRSSNQDKDEDGTASSDDPGTIQLAQFIGVGGEGDTVLNLLRKRLMGESESESTDDSSCFALTVRPTSALRTCTSIVSTKETTELVEPSGIISKDEMKQLMEQLTTLASAEGDNDNDGIETLVIMGTMPPGCDEDTYAKIYDIVASPKNTLCVIDSVIGTVPLLQTISSKKNKKTTKNGSVGGTIFKVNASELCNLVKVPRSSKSEMGGVNLEELTSALTKFMYDSSGDISEFSNYSPSAISAMAITDGPHPGYLCVNNDYYSGSDDGKDDGGELTLYQVPIPLLNKNEEMPLYPIGAGDSVAAGTSAAWNCLVRGDSSERNILPPNVKEALDTYRQKLSEGKVGDSSNDQHHVLLTAFAFGLACGSASKYSCFQAMVTSLRGLRNVIV